MAGRPKVLQSVLRLMQQPPMVNPLTADGCSHERTADEVLKLL